MTERCLPSPVSHVHIGEPSHAVRGLLNLKGLCPICGGEAERRIVSERAFRVERYVCPADGEISYATGGMRGITTPYDLVKAPPTWTFRAPAALGLLSRLLPPPVQGGTGLELLPTPGF